jgi:hypothetical protein
MTELTRRHDRRSSNCGASGQEGKDKFDLHGGCCFWFVFFGDRSLSARIAVVRVQGAARWDAQAEHPPYTGTASRLT